MNRKIQKNIILSHISLSRILFFILKFFFKYSCLRWRFSYRAASALDAGDDEEIGEQK